MSGMDDFTFVPSLHYVDPKAALAWLENAFGFETTMAIDGPPDMCHYEMSIGGRGRVMLGGEWNESAQSPSHVGGANTQRVHVQLTGDIDAHCAHARSAGATIDAELADQFYGDRTYRALDLEGHLWTFSRKVRDVSVAEAEAVIGQKITATRWS
jgi:uncharacterized glyoxalase superfamily protein PhnB